MTDPDKELKDLVYHLSLIIMNGFSFGLNLLVVVIFLRYRQKLLYGYRISRRGRKTGITALNHNKLLFSMACGDLLVSMLGISFGFLLKSNQPPDIYKLYGTIPLFGTMFVSIFSLSSLTIDRVIAGTRPLYYVTVMSNFRIKATLAVSWIVPIIITIIETVVYLKTDAHIELKTRACILVVIFAIGFAVLIISNWLLITKVDLSRRRLAHSFSGSLTSFCNPAYEKGSELHRNKEKSYEAFSELNASKLRPMWKTDANQRQCSHSREIAFLSNGNISKLRNCSTSQSYVHKSGQSNRQKDTNPNSVKAVSLKFNKSSDKGRLRSPSLMSNRERKMTIMCVCITAVYFICWSPLAGYRFSYVIGRYESIPWFRRLTFCLALVNSLLNPCIYFLVRRDFRVLLWKLFDCRKTLSKPQIQTL